MNEKEFLDQILKMATAYKIKTHHCGTSTRCTGTRGLPDLILLGTRKMACAELKRDSHDSRTPEQTAWHWGLLAAGVDSYLWTPADLPAIPKFLEGLNR